jgi:hypothetical protein
MIKICIEILSIFYILFYILYKKKNNKYIIIRNLNKKDNN